MHLLYTYTQTKRYTNIHVYIHIYMHAYIGTYQTYRTYIHACIHTYIRTHMYTYIHIYRYVYTQQCIYIYIRSSIYPSKCISQWGRDSMIYHTPSRVPCILARLPLGIGESELPTRSYDLLHPPIVLARLTICTGVVYAAQKQELRVQPEHPDQQRGVNTCRLYSGPQYARTQSTMLPLRNSNLSYHHGNMCQTIGLLNCGNLI